jgi:hypothetical protein
VKRSYHGIFHRNSANQKKELVDLLADASRRS